MKMNNERRMANKMEGGMPAVTVGNGATSKNVGTKKSQYGDPMDDTSSTSEEVISGSDQTVNISSNGGYSGDYESISDSSSGASKKLKVAPEGRQPYKEATEEKSHDIMEDGAVSQNTLMKDCNLSVEYENIIRHHHHLELDRKHPHSDNHKSNNHQRRHHETSRPNEARGQEINRQIHEIMGLYNVSLLAQASAKAKATMHADAIMGKETNMWGENEASVVDDSKDQSSKANYHYKVQSNEYPHQEFPVKSLSHRGNALSAQLGGFRIKESSDPRIDLVKLYQASQNATADLEPQTGDLDRAQGSNANGNIKDSNCPQDTPNDCYANLMEACRPFFQDSKTIMNSKKIPMLTTTAINQPQAGSDEAQSSSGFTSFFTTTKSDSNTNAGEGSSSQSDFSRNNNNNNNKKKQEAKMDGNEQSNDNHSPDYSQEDKNLKSDHAWRHSSNHSQHNQYDPSYQSDSSSMIVLARMKRKHKDQRRNVGMKSHGEAREHVSKRVRIETVALDAAKYRSLMMQKKERNPKLPESSSLSSGLSTSTGSESGSGKGGVQTKNIPGAASTSVEDRSKADSQSGSGEISKERTARTARTVTDTSGTTTVNNSSSGNDAEPTNKSEFSSQIGGSSNSDGKTRAYWEKDSLSDSNTVAAINGDGNEKADAPLIRHHNRGTRKYIMVDHTPRYPFESAKEPEVPSKEEKLIEKKRKRMSARKEYEEDLMRDRPRSGESSSKLEESNVFEAGKPVTLEDVLSFSKTARYILLEFVVVEQLLHSILFYNVFIFAASLMFRLLVQALPPFLAVHTNAAFTMLTQLDSHIVIGNPISSILSIVEGMPPTKESDSSGSDNTNNKDAISSLSGSLEGNDNQNRASIPNTNATHQQSHEHPTIESNTEGNAQNMHVPISFQIDRIVVARGYGQIHNVEVKAIESNDRDDKIFCRMCVSPVVTSIENWENTHPSGGAAVKHYLIQLESMDGPSLLAKQLSLSSSTDTTTEAMAMGITRSEVLSRRSRIEQVVQNEVNATETTDSQDDNTSAIDPVATCG